MWSKLKVRLLSAIVGIIAVVGITVWAPAKGFHAVVAVISFLILHELLAALKVEKKWPVSVLVYAFAAALLFMPVLDVAMQQKMFTCLPVTYLLLLFASAIVFNARVQFSDVTAGFFAPMYAVLFPLYLSYIRMEEHGVALIFLAFVGAWIPDTFAYFAGNLFGKRKLIPSISPNKTVAGAVGAVVGGVVVFFVYGLVVSFGFGYGVHYLPLLVLGLLCGVFAQFGDLSASLIKRACQAKDFGNLIPGHGGMMDRVDSLIFIAPIIYYFLQLFEVIYK